MLTRTRTLTVKVTDDELARVHALAEAGDESVGRLVRRWIDVDYRRRFGDDAPPRKLRAKRARKSRKS